jgi:thymidine kinase
LNSFICKKKDYLIDNLEKVIAKKDFFSRNGYLLKIYKLLADSVRKEQIDILMTQIVDKNRFQPRPEPSLEENGIVVSSKGAFVKLMTMLHHWHFLGKEIVYFRSLISSVAQENLKRICSTCSSDENLFPVEQRDFYEILKEYRNHLRGLISYAALWVTFYRKRQSFKTLCKECKLIEEIKKFKKQDKKRSYMKSEIDNSQLKNLHDQPIFKEITKEEIRPGTLRLLLLWHSTAKSNLLHKESKFEPFVFSQFKSLIEE